MPAQDRARGDQPVILYRGGQQPDQPGQDRPIGPVQPRPGIAPPQERDLVPQHQQFSVLRRARAGEQHQPADQPDEDQIQQPQRHGSRSSRSHGPAHPPRPQARTDFWNPTGPRLGRSGSATTRRTRRAAAGTPATSATTTRSRAARDGLARPNGQMREAAPGVPVVLRRPRKKSPPPGRATEAEPAGRRILGISASWSDRTAGRQTTVRSTDRSSLVRSAA